MTSSIRNDIAGELPLLGDKWVHGLLRKAYHRGIAERTFTRRAGGLRGIFLVTLGSPVILLAGSTIIQEECWRGWFGGPTGANGR